MFEHKPGAQGTLSQCAKADATEPQSDRGRETAERPRPGSVTEKRPRKVAEVASDWIWETDPQNCLTFLSKRFGDTSGIPWSRVNGRSFFDLVAEGFEPAGMETIRATTGVRDILQSAVYRIELPGSVTRFWRLSGEPRFDAVTGAFAGYRGTGTDVTGTIEHEAAMTAALLRAEAAEREAQRARKMLEEAIEAIPEGFVLHDAQDRLVLCNARYRELYGLTSELTKPGTRFEDSLRETRKRNAYVTEERDVEKWVAERLRQHRALDTHHIEQRLADGRWLQIEERRTSDGGTVGIRVDVTEARRREALERERERTIAELQAARLMQTSLLPSRRLQKEIITKSGLDIASRSASCTEIGGDLWGLSVLDRGRVGVYTLDVAGHGTTAALNTFRLHTLIHELGAWLLEPSRFLQELNVRLTELLQPGAFATMFYGVVDPESNCIFYATAGSPPPLIRCGGGLPLTALDSAGVPLGITVSAEYPCSKADFGPGAMLFLYSDILTDRTDEHGKRAGEAGAFALIQQCAGEATAEAAVERICAPFFDPPDRPLSDDLTVVCIMRPKGRVVAGPTTDPQTGVLDRRAGEARLDEAFRSWRRERHAFSVLMISFEHLPSVDPAEGHGAVLIALMRAVKERLRADDTIFRWDGEAFLLLLPATNRAMAERLRLRLETLDVTIGDRVMRIGVSLGVAEARYGDGGVEDILRRAGQAWHAARRAGRNHGVST